MIQNVCRGDYLAGLAFSALLRGVRQKQSWPDNILLKMDVIRAIIYRCLCYFKMRLEYIFFFYCRIRKKTLGVRVQVIACRQF